MKIAETVTFGGSGLDRADHLRSGDSAQGLAASADARCLLLWRGKVLITGDSETSLRWLPMNHPILPSPEDALFLGLDNAGGGLFAQELIGWQPEDAPEGGSFFDPSEQRHPDLPSTDRFVELRGVMTALGARDAELAVTARALSNWHASHRFCARCGAQSVPRQAGWQRGCDACGAVHFPRTDPVVIMLVTRGNRVLLGRSHGWPEGMYSLLAGFIEPGETMEAAVRREVEEEAGIRVGQVSYLASQPWPYPNSLMLGCRAEALSDEITVDPVELDDALWLTREELTDAFASNRSDILPARKGAIAQFILANWLADRLE